VKVSLKGPDDVVSFVEFPPNDHIGRVVAQSGTFYERDLLDALRAENVSGVYLDIGAHCGNHTVFFARHCPAERVVAVEPSPQTYDLLRQTIRANRLPNAIALLGAIHPSWTWSRSVESAWQPPSTDPTRTNTGTRGVMRGEAGQCPAWTLDEVGLPQGRVGLVKIDTEGLGAAVLLSGSQLLRRDKPLIAVEAATAEEQASVMGVLQPYGYVQVGQYCHTPTFVWQCR